MSYRLKYILAALILSVSLASAQDIDHREVLTRIIEDADEQMRASLTFEPVDSFVKKVKFVGNVQSPIHPEYSIYGYRIDCHEPNWPYISLETPRQTLFYLVHCSPLDTIIWYQRSHHNVIMSGSGSMFSLRISTSRPIGNDISETYYEYEFGDGGKFELVSYNDRGLQVNHAYFEERSIDFKTMAVSRRGAYDAPFVSYKRLSCPFGGLSEPLYLQGSNPYLGARLYCQCDSHLLHLYLSKAHGSTAGDSIKIYLLEYPTSMIEFIPKPEEVVELLVVPGDRFVYQKSDSEYVKLISGKAKADFGDSSSFTRVKIPFNTIQELIHGSGTAKRYSSSFGFSLVYVTSDGDTLYTNNFNPNKPETIGELEVKPTLRSGPFRKVSYRNNE